MFPPAITALGGNAIDNQPGPVGVVDVASTVEFHAGWLAHVVVASSQPSASGCTCTPPLVNPTVENTRNVTALTVADAETPLVSKRSRLR